MTRIKNLVKGITAFVVGMLVSIPIFVMADITGANALLDLTGTPSLVALGNNPLVIGTSGTGMLKINLDAAGVQIPVSNPADGTAATTVAANGTIDTTKFWQRTTNTAARAGIILEAGTVHGQLVFISVDKDASGTFTMDAEATSNVCGGTASILNIGGGGLFVWDATDTCWAQLGET